MLAVVEGDDIFALALSTQGEETPSYPGHPFLEPLTIQTTSNWKLLEGRKYNLINLASLRVQPGSWHIVGVH